jgi:signal transduction histidine kinase
MERRRIARELHDSVGQYLTGIKLLLGQLGRGLQHTPTTTAALLSESIELADLSLTEIRTISHLLHPPLLDELGFSSAARAYVEGFCKRSGLEIQIAIEDFEVRLPKDLELALFRILQEALTNVHRHAAATRVTVHVANRNNCVTLLMKDNGCGISPTVLHRYQKGLASGIGLAGMRERIAEWKGTFDVQSSSSGTVVFASIPHQSVWTEILEDETAAAQRDQFLEAHTDGHLETLNQEITTLSDSDAPEIDHHNNQNN